MSIETTDIPGLRGEHNTAGCRRVHLVDVDDVDTMPDEIQGNVPGDVVLHSAKQFTTVTPTTFEMSYNEDSSYENGCPRCDFTLEWPIPKDRLSLLPILHNFHQLRVVSVVETLNPDPANPQELTRLIVGNKEEPAMAYLVKRKSGADPRTDRSDYLLQVKWSRTTPTPFYNGTPPELLPVTDCLTFAQLLGLMTGDDAYSYFSDAQRTQAIQAMYASDIWGRLTPVQRTVITMLALNDQTGSEIWAALTTLQQVQAINSNTGAELWAMMNGTVQAQVLAAAGIVTVTRINNTGPPYTDVVIDPTS